MSPSDLVPWKGVEREGGEREPAMGWCSGAMGGKGEVASLGRRRAWGTKGARVSCVGNERSMERRRACDFEQENFAGWAGYWR